MGRGLRQMTVSDILGSSSNWNPTSLQRSANLVNLKLQLYCSSPAYRLTICQKFVIWKLISHLRFVLQSAGAELLSFGTIKPGFDDWYEKNVRANFSTVSSSLQWIIHELRSRQTEYFNVEQVEQVLLLSQVLGLESPSFNFIAVVEK